MSATAALSPSAASGPVLGGRPTAGRRTLEDRLLERYRKHGDRRAREDLITRLLPLAQRLASRYRNSGESQDDLEQVASVGLIKAIDRYEPEVGPFARYAVPNILGELRRHFRDKGWAIHVPRAVQENFLRVSEATERLSVRLGRTPSARDVADSTGLPLEDVVEAIDAGRSYSPAALDAPQPGEDEGRPLGDTLGAVDEHYDFVEIGASIGPAFRDLPRREQRILHLRFFGDLTQSEIAEHVGVSQMHVSRLLRRALDRLHAGVVEHDGEELAAAAG